MAAPVTEAATTLDPAIVRLRDAKGDVVGAGFLIGPRHLVTCAHVVAAAVGWPGDRSFPTNAEVRLDFPLVEPDNDVVAKVVLWRWPAEPTGLDVAVLEVVGMLPDSARPVRMVDASEVWAHPFRTFGYPSRRNDGVWSTGRLLARQAGGLVQMETPTQAGYRVGTGFSGAPVWDDELDAVVGMAVAADRDPTIRAAYLLPARMLVTVWPDLATRTVPPCPYRGLSAFREEDAPLFFGRTALAEELVEQLHERPLVAVVGPSGVGKSSLVFAGAIPRIRRLAGWGTVDLRPTSGTSPLAALASRLLPLLEPDMTEAGRLREIPELVAVLEQGRLAEVIDRVLERASLQRLLLIVDQLEELFTQTPADSQSFLDQLVLAANHKGHDRQLTVLVTVRADFFGAALKHPGLAGLLERSVVAVGQMSTEQLKEIIEGPLPDGVEYEPRLVERILDDVGTGPGNLALLEFALTLLWERQRDHMLTDAAYESLGGVEGALASYAEHIYREQLSGPESAAAQRVLTQLVMPGEATEHTRRVARRTDFDVELWTVAQQLAATRLVVANREPGGTETVEIAHEALITSWDRLRGWVEADLTFRAWQEGLRAGLRQWRDTSQDKGAVLRGAVLADAERWLQRRAEDIGPQERDFIRVSRAHHGRVLRRLRATAAMLVVLLLATGVFAVQARQQGSRAAAQGRLSLSRLLATQAEAVRERQPDLAILLSLAAYRMHDTIEARRSLMARQATWTGASSLLMHDKTVGAVQFSPDSKLLAVANGNNITLWSVADRRVVGVLNGDRPSRIVTFSPSGRLLATAGDSALISVWDVAARRRVAEIRTPAKRGVGDERSGIGGVAFRDDTVLGWIGDTPNGITLWDLRRQKRLDHLTLDLQQPSGIISVAFSPNGALVIGAGGENVTAWDYATRRQRWTKDLAKPAVTNGPALSATVSDDGKYVLAMNSSQSSIRLLDARDGDTVRVLDPGNRALTQVFDARMLRNGEVAAMYSSSGSGGFGQVVTWDENRTAVPKVTTAGEWGLAVEPTGRLLASSAGGGAVALMPIAQGSLAQPGPIRTLASSPDGRRWFVVSGEESLTLWDARTRRQLAAFAKAPSWPNASDFYYQPRVALTADSTVLATLVGGKLRVFSTRTRHVLWQTPTPTPRSAEIQGMAMRPDGTALATVIRGTNDSSIRLWQPVTGKQLHVYRITGGGYTSMAFSQDGRYLAVGGSDNVSVFDTIEHRQLATQSIAASALAFSSDGRTLAIAADSSDIQLWDPHLRSRRATLHGSGPVTSMAFSPSQHILASIGPSPQDLEKQRLGLWNVQSGGEIAAVNVGSPDSNNEPVVFFSPNGASILLTGAYVRSWEISVAAWEKHLCSILPRTFTTDEVKQYLGGWSPRDLKLCGRN
jgi:WD40 repeat protein